MARQTDVPRWEPQTSVQSLEPLTVGQRNYLEFLCEQIGFSANYVFNCFPQAFIGDYQLLVSRLQVIVREFRNTDSYFYRGLIQGYSCDTYFASLKQSLYRWFAFFKRNTFTLFDFLQ